MDKISGEGSEPGKQHDGPLDPALEAISNGVPFPLKHEALIDLARDQKVEPNLLERMETMPRRTYNTLEEFRQAFTEDLEDYGGVSKQHKN